MVISLVYYVDGGGQRRPPRGIDLLQGSPRSPAERLPLDLAPFRELPRPTGINWLVKLPHTSQVFWPGPVLFHITKHTKTSQ